MNKIKILRNKFEQYNIDGYVVPKNDDYFTEYSKINRLKIISNFSGSAGLAIILKNKNYLFTDGRYTINIAERTYETPKPQVKMSNKIGHGGTKPDNSWKIEASKNFTIVPAYNKGPYMVVNKSDLKTAGRKV